ncbi:MAG: adenylyltransferase/cytidyltransferase family protein [Candidatus Latescibacterota bacterium]|jgi:FAD synthetase
MAGRVLCCGTFDYLHPGHVSFLRQAASLGDELVVVVARDENVQRAKGRPPEKNEEERQAQVAALGIATEVRLGNPGADLLRVVAEVSPEVIALGYDQAPPRGLTEAFPHCRIVTLEPHQPERFKSSLFRRPRATD